ncbi:hypothetical protein ACFWY6_12675 [Streptomyces sp. NPDC059037]|uniref:hypothetical protein n=1 Tax=Streptomyces sp. NPDC059037 TaxID=3346710 RepID=UPI00367DEB74
MSDDATTQRTEAEAGPDEAPPSRIAGALVTLVLAGVAVLVLRLIVTAFPYAAYFVAGVITCTVWQRARAWLAKRRSGDVEESAEEELPDVGEALRTLGEGGNHVLLTALRKELGVADTKAVRALLKAEKIRVRSGVRTPAGNGPGVHHEDIPPAPPEPNEEHGEGCCCRSANNTNANNDEADPSQKGVSVEAIGQAGTLIRDPAETQQRRTQLTTGGLVDRFFDAAEEAHQKKTGKS